MLWYVRKYQEDGRSPNIQQLKYEFQQVDMLQTKSLRYRIRIPAKLLHVWTTTSNAATTDSPSVCIN
jgi:hypothetical protein